MSSIGDLCTFSFSLFEQVPFEAAAEADSPASGEPTACADDDGRQPTAAKTEERVVFHEQRTRAIIGSGELLPAVEEKLLGRRPGEKVERFSLEASRERPHPLLPNSSARYSMELQVLAVESSSEHTAQSLLSWAGDRREAGNGEFRGKKYAQAIEQYEEGVRVLNDCPLSVVFTAQEQLESSDLQTTLRLNASQCCLELGQPRRALDCVAPVLAEQPMNAKANYRAGRAQLMLKSYEAARKHLTLTQQVTPNDTGIAAMLSRLQREEEQAKQNEMTAFSKMFD